jgi:hypothetical protein
MVLATASQGIASHTAPLYIGSNENRALEWVQANTEERAVILAAPETSLWIPARTGRLVVAGHPFETVEAERRGREVEAFFRGTADVAGTALLTGVDYVFIGPRERSLGANSPGAGWRPVYVQGRVTIWAPAR